MFFWGEKGVGVEIQSTSKQASKIPESSEDDKKLSQPEEFGVPELLGSLKGGQDWCQETLRSEQSTSKGWGGGGWV